MKTSPLQFLKSYHPAGVRQGLRLILLGHLLLTLAYSVITPPWEAHDEWAHYRYAAFIAEKRALPDPGQRLTTEFEFDEASQPPLYYLLAALPMLGVNTQDGYHPQINPYIRGDNAQAGVNMAVHDPEIEGFPWRGTILALHLGRLTSVIISLLALVVTFKIIRYLSPERPRVALLGTAIQAFTPQFVFISAVITNDILVVLLESLLLLLSLRLIVEGPRPRLAWQTALVAGLALLTKYLALAVVPLAVLAFVWGAWRHRCDAGQRAQTLRSFLLLAGVLLLLAGGFFWRNVQLTGEVIPRDPVSQQSLLTGLQDGGLNIDWSLLPLALNNGFHTYWASFGWGNLSPGQWVYGVWLALIAVALLGLAGWARTRDARRARAMLFFILIFTLAVVSFPLLREILHGSPHLRGRYMLASLPVAVWVLAQGWDFWAARSKACLRFAPLAWAVGLGVGLLFFLLMPAYAAPPRRSASRPLKIPIDARFDEAAVLLSAEIWPEDEVPVHQGLAVTLNWQVLARTAQPYALDLQLLGAGGQQLGGLRTYPGHGNAATSVWRPGFFTESYWLTVSDGEPLPSSGTVLLRLANEDASPEFLPVFDGQGQAAGDAVHFGSVRISPSERPATLQLSAPEARFGDTLLLRESALLPEARYHAGGVFPVWLDWQALGPGADDLTLSLQLLDADNAWVAGDDGPFSPVLLPPHWRDGDIFETSRWFALPESLPAGEYQLVAVVYRSGDLSRLPVFNARTNAPAGDMWPLGKIYLTQRR